MIKKTEEKISKYGADSIKVLKGLEAVDLAFCLSVAPRQLDGVVDGINVPAQDTGKPHDRNEFRVDCIVDPCIQWCRSFAAEDAAEAHRQALHLGPAPTSERLAAQHRPAPFRPAARLPASAPDLRSCQCSRAA